MNKETILQQQLRLTQTITDLVQIALWMERYHSDVDFRVNEERNAYRATAGNISAWEAKMDQLNQIIGDPGNE